MTDRPILNSEDDEPSEAALIARAFERSVENTQEREALFGFLWDAVHYLGQIMHYTDYGSSFRAYETLKSARDLFVLLPAMDKLHSVEQQQRASEGARPAKSFGAEPAPTPTPNRGQWSRRRNRGGDRCLVKVVVRNTHASSVARLALAMARPVLSGSTRKPARRCPFGFATVV
jgi:hypothetical protein